MEDVVARCVAAKARIVAEDERDASARLVLNYGHTLGHALERLDAFQGRTHGEAVALGMVFAACLAESRGLAPGLSARTNRLLGSLGLETDGTLPSAEDVRRCLRLDKKYRGGVRFVLLEDVGRPVVVDDVSDEEVRSVLHEMGAAGMKVLFLFGPNLGALGRRDRVPVRNREPGGHHALRGGARRGLGPRGRLAAVRSRGRPGGLAARRGGRGCRRDRESIPAR